MLGSDCRCFEEDLWKRVVLGSDRRCFEKDLWKRVVGSFTGESDSSMNLFTVLFVIISVRIRWSRIEGISSYSALFSVSFSKSNVFVITGIEGETPTDLCWLGRD